MSRPFGSNSPRWLRRCPRPVQDLFTELGFAHFLIVARDTSTGSLCQFDFGPAGGRDVLFGKGKAVIPGEVRETQASHRSTARHTSAICNVKSTSLNLSVAAAQNTASECAASGQHQQGPGGAAELQCRAPATLQAPQKRLQARLCSVAAPAPAPAPAPCVAALRHSQPPWHKHATPGFQQSSEHTTGPPIEPCRASRHYCERVVSYAVGSQQIRHCPALLRHQVRHKRSLRGAQRLSFSDRLLILGQHLTDSRAWPVIQVRHP